VNEAFWWALEEIAAPIGNVRVHDAGSRTITGIRPRQAATAAWSG
jgi:hypothetical protein